MDKGKQLSINLVTQIISFGLNLAISFFLTPYVIQYIGKEIYGFVSLANNFTSYISVFTVALNGMLGRYVTVAFARKDYNTASKYLTSVIIANVGVMLILTPITILFVINLGSFINLPIGFERDVKLLFILMFLSFLINLPGCCYNSAPYATNRLDKSNICNMIGNIIRIVITIMMLILLQPRVWYVGVGMLISNIYVISRNVQYKKTLLPQVKISRQYFDWKFVKELLSVGMWNSINQLTNMLMTGLDLVIANLFISVLSMNLLSYAKMIPIQLTSLISMIAGLFAPQMTVAFASGDKQKFINETNFAIKICGFLCSVPIIGLIVFGENFFGLWLRALTVEEVKIVTILSILTILPQLFSVYIYPLYTVNSVTTKLKTPVMVSLALGIVNVILVFVLVKITSWEIYAVAGVSSVISTVRILVFTPIYASHSIGAAFTTFYKPLMRGLLSNAIMVGIFCVIKGLFIIGNWRSFIMVCGLAGCVGYLIVFMTIFNQEEKKKAIDYFKKKIRRA